MGRPRALLLLAISVLASSMLAAPASGVSVGTTKTFAHTHSGAVAWQTDVPIEASVVWVRNRTLTLGNVEYNVTPDPGAQVQMRITQWTDDSQHFVVTMRKGTRTGLNMSVPNAGLSFALFQGNVVEQVCEWPTAPCLWTRPNATSHTFSVRAFTQGQEFPPIGSPWPEGSPPDGGGGAGGGSGAQPPRAAVVFRDIPSPAEVFPTLTAPQWGGLAFGLLFLFSGIPRTSGHVPVMLRAPLPPPVLLVLGTMLLAFTYLSAAAPLTVSSVNP